MFGDPTQSNRIKFCSLLLIAASLLWLALLTLSSLLSSYDSAVFHCFLPSRRVLFTELLLAFAGIGLGVLCWRKQLQVFHSYLLLVRLYLITCFMIIW